jgi:type I restriction enzyme S subunit
MSKMPKNDVVPVLRFPEFAKKGTWDQKQLHTLAEIKGRIGYRGYTTNDIVNKGEGAISLSPSNIDDDNVLNFEKCTYISWDKYEESPEIMVKEGYTVLVKTASVGKCAFVKYLPEKTTINPQLVVLKPLDINPKFLSISISHLNIQSQIKANVGAGAIPNLSQESISKFEVLVPPDKEKKEQQKIADCLSSLDDLITSENQKLETLKSHKKGLMQNLFPAEGEEVPKLRFKEFENTGEWMDKKLGEIGNVLMCKRIFAEETNPNVGVPFYKIGTLGSKPDAFITRELFEEYKSKYRFPRKGEILITCSGTVGKCIIYDGEEAYFQDSNIVWIDNPTLEIVNDLLFYLLSNVNWNILNSTTITRIYNSDLLNLKIMFPKTQIEQQKIASILSSIDLHIKVVSQKIEELKLHKIGLMQNLFPTFNG